MGRTGRKRSRKTCRSYSPAICKDYVCLARWMGRHGFKMSTDMVPAEFKDTGRGLLTRRSVTAGETIVAIPHQLLITSKTVLNSFLGPFIKRSKPKLCATQALCLYLCYERAKGPASFWHPYLQVLPSHYTTAAYWTEPEISLLPDDLKADFDCQRLRIEGMYERSRSLRAEVESAFPEYIGAITMEMYRWAWCAVNTRAVYMEHKPCQSLDPAERDACILAPFLDFLNHNPHAEVSADFNEKTDCYEIVTHTSYRRYEQVFINYGPHDNNRLLVEYGFVVPSNPHAVVHFVLEDLFRMCRHFGIPAQDKEKDLEAQGFVRGLLCSTEEVSWNLQAAVRMLLNSQKLRGSTVDQSHTELHLIRWLLVDKLHCVQQNLQDWPSRVSSHHVLCQAILKERCHILERAFSLPEYMIYGEDK